MKKNIKWFVSLLAGVTLILAACGGGAAETAEEDSTAEESNVTRNWEVIQEDGVLQVATDGTYYPNSYHDADTNELTGFQVEILREIAERLDLEIEFTEMGVDGMLTSLNSEQIDISALGIDRDGEDSDKYNFTDPYKYYFGAMVVRGSDDSGIETI